MLTGNTWVRAVLPSLGGYAWARVYVIEGQWMVGL